MTYLNNFTHAIVGTVKHYAGYGLTAGGIDGSPATISEQRLREIYLEPWRYLADGRGLRSVMASQNMVNGRPMHVNKRLLTDVLRTEWGVTHALVESDGADCIGALQYGFHIAATRKEVAVMSLESGMDQDLGGVTFNMLVDAVSSNMTTEAQLDRATYNVLASKFASGIFDHPYTDESRVLKIDGEANRVMAREAAEESMVMLVNRPMPSRGHATALLPLQLGGGSSTADTRTTTMKKKMTKIALVGPLADDKFNQCGQCERDSFLLLSFVRSFVHTVLRSSSVLDAVKCIDPHALSFSLSRARALSLSFARFPL